MDLRVHKVLKGRPVLLVRQVLLVHRKVLLVSLVRQAPQVLLVPKGHLVLLVRPVLSVPKVARDLLVLRG